MSTKQKQFNKVLDKYGRFAGANQLQNERDELLAHLKELLEFCDLSSDQETEWEQAVFKARYLVERLER